MADLSDTPDTTARPFEEVAEALNLGMPFRMLVAADGVTRRFLHVGDNCLDWNGVPAEAALANPRLLYDLILPEHRKTFQQAEAEAFAQRRRLEIEVEMRHPDGDTRWRRIASCPRALPDGSVVWDGLLVDITETKAADERRSLVMGEMAHRAKNGLAVMMGIVSQTARSAGSVAEFEDVLMARLAAMARSYDLVTGAEGGAVPLIGVVREVLSAFGLARFEISTAVEGASIAGQMAAALGLLLHEMATNAVKYGALSNRTGRVQILIAEAGEGRLALHWCEVGGPSVQPPAKLGFGSRVLQLALAPFSGQVTCEYPPEGFQARAEFPHA